MSTDLFEKASLEINDLFSLESFQIGYLPGWIPERELTAILLAYPSIEVFLRKKCPQAGSFLSRLKDRYGPAVSPEELQTFEERILKTITDVLVYNVCPEVYDSAEFHQWDFSEITSITSLAGRVVLDGGAGTGRVALEAAESAHFVFAIEPVTRLREFIREKASARRLANLFVVDGFLHTIPFPDNFADVFITSHALGWNLEAELKEFERVTEWGGYIIHCPGTTDEKGDEETHSALTSPRWRYEFSRFEESDGWKRKYWKRVGAT